MENPVILLAALALDLICGDPPNMVHPVAWMGHVISFLVKFGKLKSPVVQFIYGAVVTLVTIAVFTIPVYYFLRCLEEINSVIYIISAMVLFKTTFTLKGLRQAALKIRNLLASDKLAESRFELRALVGRDTRQLNKTQMVSATIESVAESSCDSFFAPVFYFMFLGVPGAIGYRVINTLDSMIGHHGDFEYIGKFAARLDTVVNYIPARVAAITIVLTAWICRTRARKAWYIMLRDHSKTKSPNAGWTMSAAAGALDVQLEKVGYYKLGDAVNPLITEMIDSSLKLVFTASCLWSLFVILLEVIYHVKT